MGIIETDKISYDYIRYKEDGEEDELCRALSEVSIDVFPGHFVAILGANGSGKSTLAKHLNAILTPSEGTVWVDGMNTAEERNTFPVRRQAGMVFQNPDNQIIANVVEEDVAFGPENLGVETGKIVTRVTEALQKVGMLKYRKHSPNKLSGGQKQRVAIAGVLAMHPKCIVFDEPTAMLDPNGRNDVIRAAEDLNRREGVTVILITHYMEEVVNADHVFVMDHGKLVMEGNPRAIFSRVDDLLACKLGVPQVTMIAHRLRQAGLPVSEGILTEQELVRELCSDRFRFVHPAKDAAGSRNGNTQSDAENSTGANTSKKENTEGAELLRLEHVNCFYSAGTTYEVQALKDICLTIRRGEMIGIAGHTGSGKSTLIQHLNGLIRPTDGTVYYCGADINEKNYDRRALRSKVGLVFQYPEYQLFETTVLDDVCFGPLNQGLSRQEAEDAAKKALMQVGLKEKYWDASPFELSGGQKRRAAIAGVIAMQPQVLILDEPTAGLDPYGRTEILDMVSQLHKNNGTTVLLVSHSMEDMAQYTERLIVMDDGRIRFDDTPQEVFRHVEALEAIGLAAPGVRYLMEDLKAHGCEVPDSITEEEAAQAILCAVEVC